LIIFYDQATHRAPEENLKLDIAWRNKIVCIESAMSGP